METIYHRYRPLKDPNTDIRVAIIQPGRFEDEICMTFCTRRLKNKIPKYECLSYVWGPQDNPSHVRVGSRLLDNQGIVPISRNLDTALRHIRDRRNQRWFWIDALCINQKDTTERNEQVMLMAQIYPLASRVVIWLGPEQDKSDKAVEMLGLLSQKADFSLNGSFLRPLSHGMEPEWADVRVPLPFEAGEMNPVIALFERPYFKRTWVRQEVALATNAVVKVGPKEMPWIEFQYGTIFVELKPFSYGSVSEDRLGTIHDAIRSAASLCRSSQNKLWYANIRSSLRGVMCQDPRDRIYALLSLLDEEDERLNIKPDYSITVEELYKMVSRQYYNTKRELSLLPSCELSSKTLKIPSWVPDWSSQTHYSFQIDSTWSSCGWISSQHSFVGDGSIRITGVVTSTVEQVLALDVVENYWNRDEIFKTIQNLKPHQTAVERQFSSERSSLETYCRAFICNKFADAYHPPEDEAYPDFEQSVRGLELAWSSTSSWEEHKQLEESLSDDYLTLCSRYFIGRCFVLASNGHIGLAPRDTRKGDIISVLLGCRFPVVLRPLQNSGLESCWQVVGVCYIQGLMSGEAVYRDKIPDNYRPVFNENVEEDEFIGNLDCHLHDNGEADCKMDPAEILTELAGIKVEKYERKPHLLEVLPETLRAAGVALEEFTLM